MSEKRPQSFAHHSKMVPGYHYLTFGLILVTLLWVVRNPIRRPDIDHHVKIYLRVFAALMVLTVVTVAVSRLELSVPLAIALGLFIAAVKAGLVACYFMHLISEKKLIHTRSRPRAFSGTSSTWCGSSSSRCSTC